MPAPDSLRPISRPVSAGPAAASPSAFIRRLSVRSAATSSRQEPHLAICSSTRSRSLPSSSPSISADSRWPRWVMAGLPARTGRSMCSRGCGTAAPTPARPAVLERLPELRPAPVDPAAHGAELDAERVGDLLVGQALDVAQNDRGPVLGRQRHQRGVDVPVQVPVVECLGRSGLGTAQPRLGLVGQALEPDPLLAPGHVEEEVRGDPVQPALESAGNVVVQRTEHPDENLLRQVLGVVAIAGEPVGQPVDPGGMVADDLFPAWRRPWGSLARAGCPPALPFPLAPAHTLQHLHHRNLRAGRSCSASRRALPASGRAIAAAILAR